MKEETIDLNQISLKLNKIDKDILKLLAENCRISYAEIAREVHLSRMAVRERVMKMTEDGIIEKFTVQLNSAKVGLNTAIFLQVSAKPSDIDSVANELCKHNQIESVYITTGKNEIHAHGYVDDLMELNNFIFEGIYNINGVIEVDFNLITKRYKSNGLFI
ncbi:MAG: Lrp/AsnC family transcriptional regulator [Terrisporobacter sp.]|uniref:Lrp/AsnC family transcriptional regulator n=1 Tax=Terrisporobacter sp. TaxID=1965305 RepID=UPI002FCA80AF